MLHLLLAVIYLAFISLGLPDGLLGAAWPFMYREFRVPLSYAGIISMIISAGTILSSLQSDRLTRRFGPAKVTACSVAITAAALLGFSFSHSFLLLCFLAVPYGLGAGSVDAALNNYVALHYESRHMSWLHCMWGVGASAGPYVMGFALLRGAPWNTGYLTIGILQVALTFLLFVSLPLWKERPGKRTDTFASSSAARPLKLPEIIRIPGAREVMITFFCYCALEQTASLWASSYLVFQENISSGQAAFYASLFFTGITAGRGFSGFLTLRFCDTQMIRGGMGLILAGLLLLLLPVGETAALAGLIIIGLGCAPIYPCIIHSTPALFGSDKSQAVIGVQMASAYAGTCLMPPLFGLLANHISLRLLPFYLLAILILMFLMHGNLLKKTKKEHPVCSLNFETTDAK